MKTVNVFDFDKTIFDGDTEFDFYSYLLTKRVLSKTNHKKISDLINADILVFYKEIIYLYPILLEVKNHKQLIEEFWNINFSKIKPYFLSILQSDDIISSATPRILLEPVINKMKPITFITSDLYCRGSKKYELKYLNSRENKVLKFKKLYPNTEINNFYSDSDNDLPLAKLAKNAYKVTGDSIKKWIIK